MHYVLISANLVQILIFSEYNIDENIYNLCLKTWKYLCRHIIGINIIIINKIDCLLAIPHDDTELDELGGVS